MEVRQYLTRVETIADAFPNVPAILE